MNDRLYEIMNILSEECAEIIQAISKCNRFGLHNTKPGVQVTNAQHLEGEIGDLAAMIELLQEMGVVSAEGISAAKAAKFKKLEQWSGIFKNK